MASTAPVRRSDRVSLTLLLEASGKDSHGHAFTDPARTLQINQTGAVIVLNRELKTDQQVHLKRKSPAEAHRLRLPRKLLRGCCWNAAIAAGARSST
jgi:hypothetical protein